MHFIGSPGWESKIRSGHAQNSGTGTRELAAGPGLVSLRVNRSVALLDSFRKPPWRRRGTWAHVAGSALDSWQGLRVTATGLSRLTGLREAGAGPAVPHFRACS